jgi:hypothetical protein
LEDFRGNVSHFREVVGLFGQHERLVEAGGTDGSHLRLVFLRITVVQLVKVGFVFKFSFFYVKFRKKEIVNLSAFR